MTYVLQNEADELTVAPVSEFVYKTLLERKSSAIVTFVAILTHNMQNVVVAMINESTESFNWMILKYKMHSAAGRDSMFSIWVRTLKSRGCVQSIL